MLFLFIITFLTMLGLFAACRLMLVGVRQGYSLVEAQASYCDGFSFVEHRL